VGSRQRAEDRGQKAAAEVGDRESEIREKTTGVRFSHIETLLWERLLASIFVAKRRHGEIISNCEFRIADLR